MFRNSICEIILALSFNRNNIILVTETSEKLLLFGHADGIAIQHLLRDFDPIAFGTK